MTSDLLILLDVNESIVLVLMLMVPLKMNGSKNYSIFPTRQRINLTVPPA